MNKPARNKPAVLKISRSATKTGPLPFPRAKKPLSSARTSTIQSILETEGHLRKASEPESSDRLSTSRTQESLPKASAIQTKGPVPKSKIPVLSRYGYQGSASRKSAPLQTQGSAFSDQTSISPEVQTKRPQPMYSDQASSRSIPVQTSIIKDSKSESFLSGSQEQPLPKGNEPVYSDQAKGDQSAFSDQVSTSPRFVQKPGPPTSVSISSDGLSTSLDPLQTRAPVPKTKIPVLSDRTFRGSTYTSPGPVQLLEVKANKPKVTGRAFGSTFSLPTQGVKATEPFSSTRTPTSPDILLNQPRTKARGSVSSGVSNRGSLSTSPSYIERPKTSVPVSTSPSYIRRPKTSQDRASASPNRFQRRGPKDQKPVSSISKSAFRSPGTAQTRGPYPKSKKRTSPVSKRASKSFESVSLGNESSEHVFSKRAPASPVPARTPGPKPNHKNQGFASKKPGRIPTREMKCIDQATGIHDGIEIYTKPEFRSKQTLECSPSTSPDRSLALQTELADKLDRRNRHISELEMKLVQNQNLISEQSLRLAESEAVQKAKDVALEQLKSELSTAKNEYDRHISELEMKLVQNQNLISEQSLRLAENEAVQKAKDVALEQLKSELSTAKNEYDRMHLRLREADFGLEQATCKVNKYLERSTLMEDELEKARDKINYLQRQLKDADTKAEINCQSKDQLRKDVERMQEQLALDSKRIQNLQQSEKDLRGDLENRDRLITQINHELATREEEFRNLFETLKNKHTQLRSQELSIKQLEERNAALLKTNKELKNDLRYYSQMIIANDGKPFFEEVPPGINPNLADGLVPSPEEESQHKRKLKRREK